MDPAMTTTKMPAGPIEDPFSTVLVCSRAAAELAAFGYDGYAAVPGTPSWVARAFGEGYMRGGRTMTNIVNAKQWNRPAEWVGLAWAIPQTLYGTVDVPNGDFRPYEVAIADVLEFARRVKLTLFLDDQEHMVLHPISYPIEWRGLGAYQFLRFPQPVQYAGSPHRFSVQLSWPGGAPRFNSQAKDPNSEVGLPVIFRLCGEQADYEEARRAVDLAAGVVAREQQLVQALSERLAEKADRLVSQLEATASQMTEQLVKLVEDRANRALEASEQNLKVAQELVATMQKFLPPDEIKEALYGEIRKLRDSFDGKDEDVLDLLRAVRQGVRGH